ncbi:uncharacterized protein V6R79_015865 [Siganus canaliculatus]
MSQYQLVIRPCCLHWLYAVIEWCSLHELRCRGVKACTQQQQQQQQRHNRTPAAVKPKRQQGSDASRPHTDKLALSIHTATAQIYLERSRHLRHYIDMIYCVVFFKLQRSPALRRKPCSQLRPGSRAGLASRTGGAYVTFSGFPVSLPWPSAGTAEYMFALWSCELI